MEAQYCDCIIEGALLTHAMEAFLERFWCFKLFSLLSPCFFKFSFGFSCLLSDSLPKDTFFLVF